MSARWDVFYSENISFIEYWNDSKTLSAGATLTASGMEITVSSNTNFLVGTYVKVTETAKTTAYCVVAGNLTSNRLRLIQLGSAPTNAIGTAYTTSATVATWRVPIGRLRIDLSDVPPDVVSYKYLILGEATGSNDNTGQCSLFITGASDPFGEANGNTYQSMSATSPSTSNYEHRSLFNAAFSDVVTAGSSKEYIIWAAGATGTKVRTDCARLIAYRIDTSLGMFVENGTGLQSQTAVTCTGVANGSYVDVASVTTTTSGTYMIVAACSLSCNTTGDLIVGFVRRGSTEYANPRYYCVATADQYSFGYFANTDTPSSTAVKLSISNTGGAGTISCGSYYLAAFEYSAIPGIGPPYSKITTGDQTAVTTQYWGVTDSTTAFIGGGTMTTEIVCSDIRSTSPGDRWRARMRSTPGVQVFETCRGSEWGTANRIQGFMFRRWLRLNDEQPQLYLDLADSSLASKTAVGRNTAFTLLGEIFNPDTVMPVDAYKAVIVDLESGLALRNWLPEGSTDVWKKHLSDVSEVSRVIRNSTENTLSATLPSWGSVGQDTAYWDQSTKTAYIKMPSAKTPADYDQTVVVIALIRISRKVLDIQDSIGSTSYHKYIGRARNIPGATAALDVRGSGAQTSFTIGNFDLSTTDGFFKNLIGQRIWEGLRARVMIGYDKMAPSLSSFKTILNAILGIPQQSGDVFRLRLFDRSVILQKPLATISCTTFNNGNSTTAFSYQEKQVLPLLFGENIKRAVAYRVSNNLAAGTTYNYYKYAANVCKSATACYADATTQKKIVAGFTDEDPANGIIKVDNSLISDYDSGSRLAPDTLYVDVIGETSDGTTSGTALTYPGEIAYNMLTRYPSDIEASFGTSYNVSGGFTLSDSGSMSITITANSGWQYGQRLLAIDGSKKAHLQIIRITTATTVFTMVPLHEPGDDQDGTAFSGSTTIKRVIPGYNGIAAKDTLYATFKNVDSGRWRSQLQNGVFQLQAPKINLIINGNMSAADGLTEICRISFLYWYLNRLGRIGIGLPDEEFGNLLLNPGFEWDPKGEWFWPWKAESGASAALTSLRKYEGYYSMEISNQSSVTSWVSQDVVFDRPGEYVATAMASLKNGADTGFRIMVIPPGRNRAFVSAPVVVTSSQWARATLKFEVKPSMLGTGRFALIPYAPDDHSATNPQYTTNLAANICGEAMYGYYSEAEAISTLLDLSGNGDTFADQSGGGISRIIQEANPFNPFRPRFRVTDNQQATGTLYSSASSVSYTTGFTVSVVWSWDGRSLYVERPVWVISSSGFQVGIYGGVGINFYDGSGYGSVYTAIVPGKTYLITVTHSVSGGNMTTNLYVNGASTATSTRTATSVSVAGSVSITAGGGWIGQLVVYNEALSSTNRAIVESYLQDRLGCTATTVNVDNCQLFRVAAFADDTNADFGDIEFDDEIYPEVRVTYDVNSSSQELCGAQIVTDVESQLLIKSISEGKNAIQTSKRLDISGALVKDAASAAGIAGAAAGYFGRQRQSITITLLGQDDIPDIGDKIYIDMTDAPESLDGNKLWRITNVDYSGENIQSIKITAKRQVDSIADRIDIAPTEVPLGAIVLTNVVEGTFGVSQGFAEMTAMQDYYALGGVNADTTTVLGTYIHTHTFGHSHSVPSHTHTFSLGTLNYVSGLSSSLNGSAGPQISVSADNHTHPNASSGHNTQASSLTLVSSNTSPTSYIGTNHPAHYRVRFMKRNGAMSTNFPTDMIIGYQFNTVPSGWVRVTGMDGYYLRGATSTTAVSTTLTATYTSSQTSTSMAVASSSGMKAGMILTLNSNLHVAVDSVVDATHVMVRSLNSVGDAASASSGNTATAPTEVVGNTYTPTNHDHGTTIPSHTHTLNHSHVYPDTTIDFTGIQSANVTGFPLSKNQISNDPHLHSLPAGSSYTATDSITSSSASGTSVSSSTAMPDVYNIVWMKPSGGSTTELPAGAIIFWDGAVCPTGYTRLGEADNLLIGTASASSNSSSMAGGHNHTFTASSHTANHVHANCTATVPYAIASVMMASGGGSQAATVDHYHTSTASSFSSASVTLPSVSSLASSTTSGTSSFPPYKKLVLCKRN